jgi:hypothetical protein
MFLKIYNPLIKYIAFSNVKLNLAHIKCFSNKRYCTCKFEDTFEKEKYWPEIIEMSNLIF